ncbi:MAG: NADH-quinone oxidoreductase subunit [Actinomycetota bacterium]|nr:NADH-quinone oxidoreductase subunit [Actinomycetota bacterium]
MEMAVFLAAAAIVLTGALGVIFAKNPVHSALCLVMTLFGIAVLFVAQEAHFLAAVQVIVYAGAIVVLYLFVNMLLGVDKVESWETGPLAGQRYATGAVVVIGLAMVALLASRAVDVSEGARSVVAPLDGKESNVVTIGKALFTDYVFAFELTGALLVIAVIGAVVLARRPRRVEVPD